MSLSLWQRIKRRVNLWGGSYTHPDGTIELDIDAAAGIDPTSDSEEVREAKLARYSALQRTRQRQGQRAAGAMLVGFASYFLAAGLGIPTWDAIGIAALAAYGAFLLAR